MANLAQFKVFEDTVTALMARTLPDWDYRVEFKSCENKSWEACCHFNTETYTALIIMDKSLDTSYSLDYVRKIAVHEVMHILLADLCDIAELYGRSKLVDSVEHNIINRMTDMLCMLDCVKLGAKTNVKQDVKSVKRVKHVKSNRKRR